MHFNVFITVQIHGLCSLARRKVFKPSEIICQCAEEHEAFYLVLSGRVAVITPDVGKIGELKSTDSFGELPHMKVQHYNYGAIAKETTECIIINKKDAATLFADVGDSELNDTIQFLRGNALFFNWPRSHLIRLCSALKKETYPPNGFIIRQGDDSHNMYIIKKGRCVVRRDVVVTKTNRWPSGKDSWEVRQRNFVKTVTMSHLNTGDYFGENGVLTGKKRFASVVAESVVQILALNKKDFSLLAYGQTLDIFKETILGYKGLDQVKALVVKSESSGDGAKDIKATSSNTGGKATKHIGVHGSVDEIAKAKIMGTIKTIMDTVPQKQFSCHFDVEGAIMKKKKRTHTS
jgi:CRP-like cAMP-binding protein